MFNVFKTTYEGLQEVDKIDRDCWINVCKPERHEIDKLHLETQIPISFFTDPLDRDERARMETEEHCVLIILRIPFYDPEIEDMPFFTLPLGIIISPDLIVTVCSEPTKLCSSFIHGKFNKPFTPENRTRFIFRIFYQAALLYLRYLRDISYSSNDIEKELHKSTRNEVLIRLLNLEKCLVYFRTSLKANEIMMNRIGNMKLLHLSPDDVELLDDVMIEFRQALEMADVHSNILSGMMDAFASVISNNLNIVMKLLTSVTIILMLPTLVASLYGMNVALPFASSPHAFLITIGISVTLVLAAIIIFINRKFF